VVELDPVAGFMIAGRATSASGAYGRETQLHLVPNPISDQIQTTSIEWTTEGGVTTGSFVFENVPALEQGSRHYTLHVSPTDYSAWTPASIDVQPGTTGIELHVSDGVETCDVGFRVFDAATGAELTHFDVLPGVAGVHRDRILQESRPGELLLRDVPLTASIEYRVHASGYAPVQSVARVASGERAAGGSRLIDVQLEPGWGTTVALVPSGTGEAFAGARIAFDGVHVGVTDDLGRLDVRLAERPQRIAVDYPGWSVRADRWVSADGRFESNWFGGLRIELEPSAGD